MGSVIEGVNTAANNAGQQVKHVTSSVVETDAGSTGLVEPDEGGVSGTLESTVHQVGDGVQKVLGGDGDDSDGKDSDDDGDDSDGKDSDDDGDDSDGKDSDDDGDDSDGKDSDGESDKKDSLTDKVKDVLS